MCGLGSGRVCIEWLLHRFYNCFLTYRDEESFYSCETAIGVTRWAYVIYTFIMISQQIKIEVEIR